MKKLGVESVNSYNDFIQSLDYEVFERIINIISIKSIRMFLKKNPKCKPKMYQSFRVESITKKMIVDSFYKSITIDKNMKLISFIYTSIKEILLKVDNTCKEKNITLDNILKKENELNTLIDILLESSFDTDIELYFIINKIKLTLKAKKEINYICELKRKIKEREKEIVTKIQAQYKEKQEELKKEKEYIITNLEAEIKQLKNEKKELEFNNLIIIDNLKEEYETREKNYKYRIKDIEKSCNKLEKEKNEEKKKFDKELLNEKNKIEQLNKRYIEKVKELEEVNLIINKKTIEFNNELEDKFKKNNFKLIKEIEVKKNELENISKKIQELKDESEKINKKKLQYENDIEYLEKNLLININKIKGLIGEVGIKDNSSYIHSICEKLILGEVYNTSDIKDFIYDLEVNLEIAGIESKFKGNLAKYLTAIMVSKTPIALIGYNSRGVAKAISTSMYGQAPEIINLSQRTETCESLIKHINKSSNKVILLENIIESFNENIYLPIVKAIKDKIVLFSMENSDNIHIINRSIFNYIIPIDIEYVGGLSKNEEMIISLVSDGILDISKKNVNYFYELISNRYDNINVINKVMKYILSNAISIMNETYKIDIELVFNIIAQYTIYPLSKNKGRVNSFIGLLREKKIESYTFEEFINYIEKECGI